MKIIEQQLIGKHAQDDCEDGIVVTPHFVAVIDGSTSKSETRVCPTMKNGRYCMMLVSEFISNMRPEITVDDFCREITKHVGKAYALVGTPLSTPSALVRSFAPKDRLCASAIVYSRWHRQVWIAGDCQCLIEGCLYENSKPFEAYIAAHRAEIFAQCCTQHSDMTEGQNLIHDYARDAILPQLIQAMEEQNHTYAVIDGTPLYRPGVKVLPIGQTCGDIVLASDGYPFLKSTLAATEEALTRQLAADPFNICSFKATKGLMKGNRSFDDRAYVRFTP